MQSRVPIAKLRRLALKELADNGLDAADAAGRRGGVAIRKLSAHQYQIEDQGDGLVGTPEQLAALFSLFRPMISGKFWRLPSRGALGNGLRIIVGCIVATGGTIEITSRDRRILLRPAKSGLTEIVAVAKAEHPTGTRIVVTFGPDLPEDPDDLSWARNAISLSRVAGPPYARGASPHWFDLDQLVDTLAIIEPGETTARQFIERLDGCSGAKAGRVAAPFGKNRTCRSMTEADAAALLAGARAGARPIKPEALGPIGAAAFSPADYGYARQCGSFVHGAHAPQAIIPFIVESWVSVANRKGSDAGITACGACAPWTKLPHWRA